MGLRMQNTLRKRYRSQLFTGVPAIFRTELLWTPSGAYWVGALAVGAGLISLLCAGFATEKKKKKKAAPEISEKVLEPVPV